MFGKLLIIFVFSCSASGFLDVQLITSFLNNKYLKYTTILTCYNRKNEVKLAKQLNADTIYALKILNLKYVNILNAIYTKYKKIGVILDGDCQDAHKLLQKCRQYKCFDTKHFWLIMHSLKNYTYLVENVNINVDSEIRVAYQKNVENVTEGYVINDVYNPASQRGGEIIISEVGTFDTVGGYKVNQVESKYFSRRNLTGVLFRTLIVLPQPYSGALTEYLKNDKNMEINILNRFHSRLMHYCRDYYNFSMTIKSDISWGFLKPDGTMDGLVGELEKRAVDFGLSPLLVKSDRAKVIMYGRKTWDLKTKRHHPEWQVLLFSSFPAVVCNRILTYDMCHPSDIYRLLDRGAFIFRKPKSRKSYQIFIKPLSQTVWTCVTACAILSVFIQKISSSLDRKITRRADSSWGLMMVGTFGAFCQQGTASSPYSMCGKISVYVTLLLGSVIYQFYSASLVSFLLNVPTTLITSTEQLMDHNFKLGCEDILYFKDFLKVSTDNVTKEVYRRLLVPHGNKTGFLHPQEGLNLVKKGQYAFHVELATAYPIMEKNYDELTICDLKEVPMFGSKGMHANYQKQSPFRDVMDICLHRFAENGVLNREKQFWHPRKPECIRSADTININTGLVDFYPALVILILGMILSAQILVVEFLYNYRNNMVVNLKKQNIYPYFK